MRQWQAAIFRRYAVLVAIGMPAFFFGPRWLIVPLGCWLGVLLARATRALGKNRRVYPAGPGRNFLRLITLIPIIATLDLAAFIGSINWLLMDKLHLTGSRRNNGLSNRRVLYISYNGMLDPLGRARSFLI